MEQSQNIENWNTEFLKFKEKVDAAWRGYNLQKDNDCQVIIDRISTEQLDEKGVFFPFGQEKVFIEKK